MSSFVGRLIAIENYMGFFLSLLFLLLLLRPPIAKLQTPNPKVSDLDYSLALRFSIKGLGP